MKEADLIIKDGIILTFDKDLTIYSPGMVAIKKEKIIYVGEIQDNWEAKKIISCPEKIVMPGLINAHTHTPMSLFRGLADDVSFNEWWEKKIFPAEKKFVSPEFVHWGTKLAVIEMIYGGITTFCDMYFFSSEIANTCEEIGLRGVISEGLMDFASPNFKTAQEGLNYTHKFIESYENKKNVFPAVATHAPYTCSDELLKKARELARKYNLICLIHLAETKKEVEDSFKEYGCSPVERLNNLGYLDEKVAGIHCVHLNKKDIQILKDKGVGIIHCPQSNLKLASGIAPLPLILEKNIKLGLGTDGCASNNDLDMFSEMQTAALIHKGISGEPTLVDAKTILKIATINGAKVLGLDDKIGSLEKEKFADIIIIDFNKPHLSPVYDYYSHLVYTTKSSDVETVIVNGKILMENRKLLTVNEKEVIAKATEYGEKIKNELV